MLLLLLLLLLPPLLYTVINTAAYYQVHKAYHQQTRNKQSNRHPTHPLAQPPPCLLGYWLHPTICIANERFVARPALMSMSNYQPNPGNSCYCCSRYATICIIHRCVRHYERTSGMNSYEHCCMSGSSCLLCLCRCIVYRIHTWLGVVSTSPITHDHHARIHVG